MRHKTQIAIYFFVFIAVEMSGAVDPATVPLTYYINSQMDGHRNGPCKIWGYFRDFWCRWLNIACLKLRAKNRYR